MTPARDIPADVRQRLNDLGITDPLRGFPKHADLLAHWKQAIKARYVPAEVIHHPARVQS